MYYRQASAWVAASLSGRRTCQAEVLRPQCCPAAASPGLPLSGLSLGLGPAEHWHGAKCHDHAARPERAAPGQPGPGAHLIVTQQPAIDSGAGRGMIMIGHTQFTGTVHCQSPGTPECPARIWNPHTMDKNVDFCIYLYIQVYTFISCIYLYIRVYTSIC